MEKYGIYYVLTLTRFKYVQLADRLVVFLCNVYVLKL